MMVPGLYCPGLIEAWTANRRCNARQSEFRGSIAPASLKQELVRGHRISIETFRGSIAPASLKRTRHIGVVIYTTVPGLYCPGLIEAS